MTTQIDGYTGEVAGRAGDVSARFERLPYKLKDGKPRFCHGEFGSDLIESLYRVLPPEPKRFLFGAGKCQQCGNKLPEQSRPQTFDLSLELRDLDLIRMTVELPAVRCEGCGTEHRTGDRNVESDLSDAMIAAFESVGLSY